MTPSIHITYGPACRDLSILKNLIATGVENIRINLSHIKMTELPDITKRIRGVSKEIKIGADIRGRKLRIGALIDGKINLRQGRMFRLFPSLIEMEGDRYCVSINFPDICKTLRQGAAVLLDDGAITLSVKEIYTDGIVCEVLTGGVLPQRSGVNIPGIATNLAPLTELDYKFMEYFADAAIDNVYLSYVESASDINILRESLKRLYKDIPIMAKVELLTAVKNLKEIADVTESICIARGDLGTEIPLPRLPFVQRYIVETVKKTGKPVILAGELLFSLVTRYTPFRAELTDIVNAVEQHVDGFILSDETAVGVDPINAVNILNSLIKETMIQENGNGILW
jgi:pyruvate kinase